MEPLCPPMTGRGPSHVTITSGFLLDIHLTQLGAEEDRRKKETDDRRRQKALVGPMDLSQTYGHLVGPTDSWSDLQIPGQTYRPWSDRGELADVIPSILPTNFIALLLTFFFCDMYKNSTDNKFKLKSISYPVNTIDRQ